MLKLKSTGNHLKIVLALANSPTPLSKADLCKVAGTTNIKTALWRLTGKTWAYGYWEKELIRRVKRGWYEVTDLGLATLAAKIN